MHSKLGSMIMMVFFSQLVPVCKEAGWWCTQPVRSLWCPVYN